MARGPLKDAPPAGSIDIPFGLSARASFAGAVAAIIAIGRTRLVLVLVPVLVSAAAAARRSRPERPQVRPQCAPLGPPW